MHNREIPLPEDAVFVRLQLSRADTAALAALGSRGGIPSVAAVCRLALSLLARGEAVTAEAVLAEAERVRVPLVGPRLKPRTGRPRGRPPKKSLGKSAN